MGWLDKLEDHGKKAAKTAKAKKLPRPKVEEVIVTTSFASDNDLGAAAVGWVFSSRTGCFRYATGTARR